MAAILHRHFCQTVGLDYVSCSPYRVPIARLAAQPRLLAPTKGDRPTAAHFLGAIRRGARLKVRRKPRSESGLLRCG